MTERQFEDMNLLVSPNNNLRKLKEKKNNVPAGLGFKFEDSSDAQLGKKEISNTKSN